MMKKRYSMERLKSSLRIITFISLLIISASSSHLYFLYIGLIIPVSLFEIFFSLPLLEYFFFEVSEIGNYQILIFYFLRKLITFSLKSIFLTFERLEYLMHFVFCFLFYQERSYLF